MDQQFCAYYHGDKWGHEEHNENKYLILVHTNESKHTKKVWRTVEQNRRSYKINK